jgi:LysR family glycine cleavage system transcriptional activator
MSRRLPPLNALRAFEAAARHLSFLKAGEELHVTPGAISQQVKALEEWLAVPLFRRQPRGVLLTDAGQTYWPVLRDLFDRLEAATQRILRDEATHLLTVSTLPSFAARWLIPRLGALHRALPHLEVRVVAAGDLANFVTDEVDVAIRFGRGSWPGLRAEFLMAEEVFPVCSPALLEGRHKLHGLDDLRHHTLLHEFTEPGVHELSWGKWLTQVGVSGIDVSRGPKFTYTHMCLLAAAAGQGVALATSVLIGDDLATGQLVRPFPHAVPSPFSYYFVCPEAACDRPKIAEFRAWMMQEVAALGRDRAAAAS